MCMFSGLNITQDPDNDELLGIAGSNLNLVLVNSISALLGAVDQVIGFQCTPDLSPPRK